MLSDKQISNELTDAMIDAMRVTLEAMLADNRISRADFLRYDLSHVTITVPPVNPIIV